ncbi:alkaline phosphatase [Holotrichia oblita]|uniref:Alkaline phosphatase n=1 Tax=Holotrichia oblita TaxID=644536 RepID=A0ACB9SQ05_HOLOL|nr:alkaline phosphatase [Holotrichia oblita]
MHFILAEVACGIGGQGNDQIGDKWDYINLLVGLVNVLTDIIWRFTISWNLGNAACKIIRYLQVVITYGSTYLLVSLSIDRCDAIRYPMQFSSSYHPQCWIAFEEQWQWRLYMTVVAISLFVIPVIIISYCYLVIIFIIRSRSKKLSSCNGNKAKTSDLTDWASISQDGIEKALKRTFNEGIAKNVIIFIADGMGITTSTAARIYGKGEQGFLTFDKFPNIGVLKTYSANKYVPDSCSTATAMFCGVKANQKTTGVDSTVDFEDCFGSLNPQARVSSIINWAQDAGFVTTTRVTHATPSALFAHSPNRNWECEAVIPDNSRVCKDIARQLIEDQPGKNINVIMGGGRQVLQSNVVGKNNDPIDTWACYSKDGRDLIKDWKDDKIRRNASYAFVSNNGELNNLNTSSEFVLGIFANGHLSMDHARDRSSSGMPSLANMTEKAIQVLQKNENGYILMVEGGLIDFGHHRGHAKQALNEAVRFSDTIERTLELIKDYESDTLVIVTSDHAHSLVFSGYADRGESVLGVAQKSKYGDFNNYTTLLYGTGGPNNYQFYVENNSVVRPDPALQDTEDFEYSQQAVVLTDEVTHSGADVLIYAKGPQAHMFHTVHDQTYVAYVIAYAAKIGPYSGGPSLYLAQTNLFLYIIICLFIYKFV